MIARLCLRRNLNGVVMRCYNQGSVQNLGSGSSTSTASEIKSDVPGLSAAVILPAAEPVGPGVDPSKNGPYKVPEYFCYDNTSFFEAEIEMAKFRLPQPSAVKK
ncbi:PREDICTED: uncharacterized protein LOC106121577 [Papilio xuthus]|uniref:Uncharacterized protein LOC106121577 n=1 Tax=Papilio xuthus TaxID=66420 RepID=A0A194PGD5_PAPXU|nr:PREDICTED: uncharacterized protein LOC106121577 [Papilio xuthus]KPI92451.1 hypothetical protein RR46_13672 [Papilio xuthus]